ncbi:MAG: wax ester/triacylglycerol synthase family O-acyltransferase [Acidimicrobiales bacterium]
MSPLDAEFWYLEDATVSLHIGACAVFEGPAPSLDTFVAMTRSKLARVPRFRQVVHPVPLGLGRPVWVDDVHFELEYHLRHAALPAPGDDAQLRRLAAQILSTQLDRSRPLWEEWLIEGLEGDRWAVVAKVHHCMVDGVSGAEMMEVLLDLEPDVAVPPPAPWEPEPGPNDTALVLGALGGLAGQVAHHAGRWRRCWCTRSASWPTCAPSSVRCWRCETWRRPRRRRRWTGRSRHTAGGRGRRRSSTRSRRSRARWAGPSTMWCSPPSPAACATSSPTTTSTWARPSSSRWCRCRSAAPTSTASSTTGCRA